MLNFEYKNYPSSSQEKSQINKSMSAYPDMLLVTAPTVVSHCTAKFSFDFISNYYISHYDI